MIQYNHYWHQISEQLLLNYCSDDLAIDKATVHLNFLPSDLHLSLHARRLFCYLRNSIHSVIKREYEVFPINPDMSCLDHFRHSAIGTPEPVRSRGIRWKQLHWLPHEFKKTDQTNLEDWRNAAEIPKVGRNKRRRVRWATGSVGALWKNLCKGQFFGNGSRPNSLPKLSWWKSRRRWLENGT